MGKPRQARYPRNGRQVARRDGRTVVEIVIIVLGVALQRLLKARVQRGQALCSKERGAGHGVGGAVRHGALALLLPSTVGEGGRAGQDAGAAEGRGGRGLAGFEVAERGHEGAVAVVGGGFGGGVGGRGWCRWGQ